MARTATVAPEDIDRAAARPVMSDPPTVRIGGFDQGCQDCHAIFESAPDHSERLAQHTHIALDHGINNRCDNCHDRDDRDRLLLYGRRTVGFDDVEQLCARCHGPTFRDWERGVHGKTVGSWDRNSPDFRRMACTECHDPHAPAFEPIAPLPPPNTLRMNVTERNLEAHSREKRNPLRTWSLGTDPPHGTADETTRAPGGSAAAPDGGQRQGDPDR